MKKITQYVSVIALFIVPLFSLIVANSYFFPFITGKAFFFRIIVEIVFASWVVLAFMDPKYRPKWTGLNIAVSLFALIALIADLLGVNPIRSLWSNFERMEGWLTIIHLWAFYMTATSLFGAGAEGRKLWHRWINVSLAVATIVSLYGIGQLMHIFAIHQSAARLDATIGNSAYLGIYIAIHMFLVAYMFFAVLKDEFAGKPFLRWAYPVLFILFGIVVLETQTRGAVIGLSFGFLVTLVLYTLTAGREAKKSRRVTGIIVVVLVLLGILFFAERKQPIFANSPIFGRLSSLSLSEFQLEGRAYIWPMAINGGLERPILGWGQENFNYIFNADYAPQLYNQEQWFDRAHSVFLDWFVATGFVGLIAYIALFVLSIIMIWKSDMSAAKKSVLTGLIIGYGINNLAVFDNLTSYVMFFAALSFINSFRPGRGIKAFGETPMRLDAVEYVIAPIVIVLLVGVVYIFNVRPIQANTRLIGALQACGSGKPDASLFESALSINTYVANQEIREQLLSCASQALSSQQVPNQLKQQLYAITAAQIEAQIKATPKDARAYVLGGSFFNDIGQTEQATALFEKAHELSPAKQSIDIALANDYLTTGENNKALALLKQSYDSETDNFSAKFAYAIGLVIANKETEAKAMFNNDPKIFETAQMANILSSIKKYSEAIDIFKRLIAASPTDVNLRGALAQTQFAAGMKSTAIQTLKDIEKTNPEYKDQVEAAIKQINSAQ